MAKKTRQPREPLKLEYENNQLKITWDYSISRVINGKSENYTVTVNDKFTKITGIRQAVFICKTETPNLYRLTTTEPPEYIKYKLIKPHYSQKHAKIILPKKIMKVQKGQRLKLTYYPNQTDAYQQGGPRIELELYNRPPNSNTKSTINATIQEDGTRKAYLQWTIKKGQIHEELQPYLSEENRNQIQQLKNATVKVETDTLNVTVESLEE